VLVCASDFLERYTFPASTPLRFPAHGTAAKRRGIPRWKGLALQVSFCRNYTGTLELDSNPSFYNREYMKPLAFPCRLYAFGRDAFQYEKLAGYKKGGETYKFLHGIYAIFRCQSFGRLQ
jgi:hypothetical protein